MKKKLLVLCLVVMFVLPATVFAGSFLGLKVGAAAILNEPINLEEMDPDYFTSLGLEDMGFGADIRFNVSVFELAALVQGQMVDTGFTEYLILSGHLGVGVSLELLGLVDLGVTIGPTLDVITSMDDDYSVVGVLSNRQDPLNSWFIEIDESNFEYLPLEIRATVDVNLGGISVGGFVMIDPGLSIGAIMDPEFVPGDVEFDTTMATLGISVLFALL